MSTITTPLGKLEKIRVREAWPDEARNFTPWLAHRGVIESETGPGALDWIPVRSKPSNVELAIQGRDPSERNDWEEQHKLLFAIGEKFHRAFAPRVKAL